VAERAPGSGVSPVTRRLLVALAAVAALLTGGLDLGGRLAVSPPALAAQAGGGALQTSGREARLTVRSGELRAAAPLASAVAAVSAAASQPGSAYDGPAGPASGASLPALLKAPGPAPGPGSSYVGAVMDGPGERAPPVTTGT
jgi:peptidoglycan/LPS O-acetylase OafA/YrhL